MKKRKCYYNTKFPAPVLEEAHNKFRSILNLEGEGNRFQHLSAKIGEELWGFDSKVEFLAEYPKSHFYMFDQIESDWRFNLAGENNTVDIEITLPEKKQIETVFAVFEKNIDKSKIIISSESINIFIGHGHDSQWKDLKDHLHDKQGFNVIAYEVGPRAGLSVKEVLENMLQQSYIAFLVLTGEDLHTDGEFHARENVIHELGLFQGKLGFKKAIALLEDNVKEFSNILGINQIRFPKGMIQNSYGDVMATIRREFELIRI